MAIIIKDASGNVLPQNPEDLNDYNIRSEKYKIPSTVDESHTHLISQVEGTEFDKHKRVVYSRAVWESPANSGIALALTRPSGSGVSFTYVIDFEGTTGFGDMNSMFRYSLLIHVRNSGGTILVQPDLFALKDRTQLNFYYQILADRVNVYIWHTGTYWNIQVISSEFLSGTTRGVASSDCSNIDSLPSSTLITKQVIHNSQTLDLSPYLQSQYNGSYNYLGGGYVGGGLEKPNNSLFGAGKLKLQMLRGSNINAPDGWYDTLWLSSYTGGDVKSSNLLSFSKGADRIGFSRQDYDSGAWGTWREIWHTGNFNPANLLPLSGGNMTGILIGQNSTGAIAVGTLGTPSFEVSSNSANAAYMNFHRVGSWVVRLGLDTDNQLKVGGGSMGNVAHTIWHAGNLSGSSREIKKDIEQTNHQVNYEVFKGLKVHDYNLIDESDEKKTRSKDHIGLITDEVPDFLTDKEQSHIKLYDLLSLTISTLQTTINKVEELEIKVDYTQLVAPMIDVIQKQQKRIDEIERLLERLA